MGPHENLQTLGKILTYCQIGISFSSINWSITFFLFPGKAQNAITHDVSNVEKHFILVLFSETLDEALSKRDVSKSE